MGGGHRSEQIDASSARDVRRGQLDGKDLSRGAQGPRVGERDDMRLRVAHGSQEVARPGLAGIGLAHPVGEMGGPQSKSDERHDGRGGHQYRGQAAGAR